MKLEKSYKKEKNLFISVKPEFVEKIFDGTKTIELRKSAPKVQENDIIVIYSTSPVMSIMGTCRVNKIVSSTPEELWENYNENMGIDKIRYCKYFEKKDIAVGIFIKDIKKINQIIPLSKLRLEVQNFHPPQTYRYLDSVSFKKLIKLV